jgi:hypothetical protein
VSAPARFHDRQAVLLWITALVWDAAALGLTWLLFAGGMTASASTRAVVLAIAAASAVGITAYALASAALTVEATAGGGVIITRRHPLWLRRQVLPPADVLGASIVEESYGGDVDGSYYVARLALRDQPPIDLARHARRDRVEAALAHFNALRRS